MSEVNRVLRVKPTDAGMRVNLWDGKTLSAWIEKTYGVQISVRQLDFLPPYSPDLNPIERVWKPHP